MKIFENINIVESFPALYIDSLDLIVLADLHLGYETAAVEQGMFIPKVQFKKTCKLIEQICRKRKAKRVLINGDVKHEFSETKYHEYKEVSNFFQYLKKFFDDIIMIKGNHDNYIIRITRKYDISLYDEYREKNIFFIHGHLDKDLSNIDEKNIILAHEHPSLGLYTEMDVKENMKCFLYGHISQKNILVMPAFSYFAPGSNINLIPKYELLSPILKKIDIDSMNIVGILEGEKCLSFPKLGRMRKLYGR